MNPLEHSRLLFGTEWWPSARARRPPERSQGLGRSVLACGGPFRRHCPSILCACSIAVFWRKYIQHIGTCLGCSLPAYSLPAAARGYGQEPDLGASPAKSRNLSGRWAAEVVPMVTRAGAHDDFGRIVFDWPRAVAYGARIEEKTLTVMFDRHLTTTFQQIPRNSWCVYHRRRPRPRRPQRSRRPDRRLPSADLHPRQPQSGRQDRR